MTVNGVLNDLVVDQHQARMSVVDEPTEVCVEVENDSGAALIWLQADDVKALYRWTAEWLRLYATFESGADL